MGRRATKAEVAQTDQLVLALLRREPGPWSDYGVARRLRFLVSFNRADATRARRSLERLQAQGLVTEQAGQRPDGMPRREWTADSNEGR